MSLKNNIQDKLSNFNSSQNLLDASINYFLHLGINPLERLILKI